MPRLGVNKTRHRGNLGFDPELRHTNNNNTAVTNLRLAVNERRGGNIVPIWFDVVVFGDLAEACCRHLRKGALIEVEGRLRHETFTDRDGVARTATKIEARSIDFL